MSIKISCQEDAGSLDEHTKYGLCITLETPDNPEIPVYQQVKQRISVLVEVRAEN